MFIENRKNWLQRFAGDGTDAAGAKGAGSTAQAAGAGQPTGEAAGRAANGPDAADRKAGDAQSADAGAAQPSFDELIRGPYKADFDARMQSIVKGRLARARQTEAAAAKMQGVLDVLAQHYGKDGSDYDGILQALNSDAALYAGEAAAAGMDVDRYMRMKQLERQNEALRREQAAARQQARARAEFAALLRQGESLRQKYPGFDLRTEMAQPGTVRLLKAGVPLQAVYELNHRRELTAAAAAAGAERVAAGIAANQTRPPEAGAAGTGSASAGIDPAKLTRAQREDIKRRVANGERIVLSRYVPTHTP